MLLLMLMFMFIPIPMLLLLFFSFCFGFDFGFGFLFLFAAVESFCFIPERGCSVPVDLSGRGAEQRFCVFYPHFPSSVRRGAASDRVVYRKHGYSAQSGGRTLFHDHLSPAFSGLFRITKVCFV